MRPWGFLQTGDTELPHPQTVVWRNSVQFLVQQRRLDLQGLRRGASGNSPKIHKNAYDDLEL
jgi:hypothetical protein